MPKWRMQSGRVKLFFSLNSLGRDRSQARADPPGARANRQAGAYVGGLGRSLAPRHPKRPQRSVSEATEEQQPGGGSEGLWGVGAEVLKGDAAIIVLPAAPLHQEGCGSTLGFVNW